MPKHAKPGRQRRPGARPHSLLPTEDARLLGNVLREFRNACDISQEKLGYRAGVTKNYVSDVESARRNPTVRVLTQLLEGLGVSWTEFGLAYDRARKNGNADSLR